MPFELREMAERAKSSRSPHSPPSTEVESRVEPSKGPAYPIPDEELASELLLEKPDPTPITGPLADAGLIDRVLEVWAFCQAFNNSLKLSPFSLGHFLEAVAYDDLPNPILEAVHLSFFGLIIKERRTAGKVGLHKALSTLSFASIFGDELDSSSGSPLVDPLASPKSGHSAGTASEARDYKTGAKWQICVSKRAASANSGFSPQN